MKRDYLSASALKAFAKSPNHYIAYVTQTIAPTPAMELGSAVHCYVLEPHLFTARYAIAPQVDRRTKDGKSIWATFCETHESKTILTQDQWETIVQIADAVKCHPAAVDLLTECTYEQKMSGSVWNFPFTGIADAVNAGYVLDLKTCRDASPDQFYRDAYNLKYHWQAAIYRELFGVDRFYWIAVETTAPYNVAVYQQSDDAWERTLPQLRQAIDAFRDWNGEPASYSSDVMMLHLPNWTR